MPARSKKQARFFGAVAGGRVRRKGLTKARAREMLRGTKVSRLPTRSRRSRRGRSRRRR